MLFSVLKRDARANAYALTSTEAVAALSRLRQQTLPSLVQVPPFTPKVIGSPPVPAWINTIARQAFYALVIAGLVLTAAITIPSVLTWRDGGSASAATALHSSIGPTGTADTRVEDLSVGTFTGRIPFIQQHRYATVASGAIPAAEQFVMGAREAQLALYITDVGSQMTLRYLNNAGQTQLAVAELERKKAEEDAARLALAPGYPPSGISLGGPSGGGGSNGVGGWHQTSIAAGTRLGTTITFYACVGNGFCGNTASGLPVSTGHAACSYNLPFGTQFRVEGDPTGQVFTCTDRGALSSTWVDVWFYTVDEGYAWQSNVGNSGTIVILG